ncbi:unnamed protein product [Urochloa humidicola]
MRHHHLAVTPCPHLIYLPRCLHVRALHHCHVPPCCAAPRASASPLGLGNCAQGGGLSILSAGAFVSAFVVSAIALIAAPFTVSLPLLAASGPDSGDTSSIGPIQTSTELKTASIKLLQAQDDMIAEHDGECRRGADLVVKDGNTYQGCPRPHDAAGLRKRIKAPKC